LKTGRFDYLKVEAMQVTNVTKTGTTRVSAGLSIRYSIPEANGAASEISGVIVHEGDRYIGHYTAKRSGLTSFSLIENHGLSNEDIKRVMAALLSDTASTLN
jgi:hypothetical protein